jgi:hypothetical protein
MRGSALLLAGAVLLLGCSGDPATTEATALRPDAAALTKGAPGVGDELAALRQVTVEFHDFDEAMEDGWDTKITPCMTSSEGGMGFHYGNMAYINDGVARADQPELLLYEPQKNGRMKLVAVEYIVPYALHPRSDPPPMLFGQAFKQVDAFGLWGLHAWVWQGNPNGTFADWNPNVNCDNTTDVMPM